MSSPELSKALDALLPRVAKMADGLVAAVMAPARKWPAIGCMESVRLFVPLGMSHEDVKRHWRAYCREMNHKESASPRGRATTRRKSNGR